MGINASTFLAANDIDVVYASILGLAFILLIVFCVMSAKTWHWVNIVFVVLSFLAGVAAIFGLTEVYKLRTDAIASVNEWERKAEEAEAAANLQIVGDPTSLAYEPGSLRFISETLTRELAGRGRVWSHGQITPDNERRDFTFSNERPVGPEVQPLLDVVLHAFLERQVTDRMVPANYIGSVRVSEESPKGLKLEAVALADSEEFAQPTGTWTLFEKMPLDRRGSFKKATIAFAESNPSAPDEIKDFVKGLKDENKDLDITKFRQILTANFLAAETIGFDPASREYEELIDRYAFDGLSLGKIQNWIDQNSAGRKVLRFEPPPEEVFIKYQFNKASTNPYQVDANGSVETEGQFNGLGHAIDEALHHGGPVTFDKGDTVLVDKRSADGYARGDQQIAPFKNNEDVTMVDQIFIRQVRDFPFEFSDVTIQVRKASEEIDRVTKANVVQAESLVNTRAQIDERSRLTGELESDRANLRNDLDTIIGLGDRKSSEVSDLQQQVSSLQRQIKDAYLELRHATIQLTRKAFAVR